MFDYLQLDDNELLDSFLNNSLFTRNRSMSTNTSGRIITDKHDVGVELIVRPECNQKCEYCYIYRYGHELYPAESRVDNETILRNLDSFLKYTFYTKKSFINHWELFAGDMFYDNLIFDIFQVFYDNLKPIYDVYTHFFQSPVDILIPCNCSFILNNEKVKLFDEWLAKLNEINCRVILSYSTDGLYATDSREKKTLNDEYYDKTLSFCSAHNYLPHPMISPENIDNQIENIKWWRKMWQKHYPKRAKTEFLPMFLEVRNDGWNFQKIQSYLRLLDFIIKERLDSLDGDKEAFAKELFQENHTYYKFYSIEPYTFREASRYTCSIQKLVHITLNDLSIVPCHRTAYSQFHVGQFVLDQQNNICGVKAQNISLGLTIHFFKPNTLPKCTTCINNDYCMHGCLGSQYEISGEIFEPIESVCFLLQSKTCFLLDKYFELGLIDIALQKNYITLNQYNRFKDQYERMKQNNVYYNDD